MENKARLTKHGAACYAPESEDSFAFKVLLNSSNGWGGVYTPQSAYESSAVWSLRAVRHQHEGVISLPRSPKCPLI